jgi:ClpP class serine protease
MPNWKEVLDEIKQIASANPLDEIRNKYLSALQKKTDRNVIAYYSGWLQRPSSESGISDLDMNSFMTTIYNMDKAKGLDLILHTPLLCIPLLVQRQ